MQAPTTTTRKPTLKKGSKPYLFHIESRSRPGRFYVTDAYHMTCTCEAGRARRLCWHVRLAVRCYDWWKCEREKARVPAGVPARGQAPSVPALQQTETLVELSSFFE